MKKIIGMIETLTVEQVQSRMELSRLVVIKHNIQFIDVHNRLFLNRPIQIETFN